MLIEDNAEKNLVTQEDSALDMFNAIKSKQSHLKFDSARQISTQNLEKVREL